MPAHAKQVGILCQRVIDLLGLSMTEGQSILLGESNIAHMVSRHPADFALYGEYIPAGPGSRHPPIGDAGSVTPPDSQTERGRCRDAAAFCF